MEYLYKRKYWHSILNQAAEKTLCKASGSEIRVKCGCRGNGGGGGRDFRQCKMAPELMCTSPSAMYLDRCLKPYLNSPAALLPD